MLPLAPLCERSRQRGRWLTASGMAAAMLVLVAVVAGGCGRATWPPVSGPLAPAAAHAVLGGAPDAVPVRAGETPAPPEGHSPTAAAANRAEQPALEADPATAAVRESPEVRAALDALAGRIEAERQRRGVAGLSVSVVYDQSLLWSAGFGMANVETGAPATGKTLYRVGSITKLFTDTMLMQLRDAGKVQLDDPIQMYLPELQIGSRYGGNQPTLRELASHTSGLPREAPLTYWRTREFPTEQELIESLRNTSLVGPPGGVYQYSNLGVAVEGIALERAAGQPYIPYVTEHILKPLGMKDSGFVLTDAAKQQLALGTTLTTSTISPPPERYPDFGAMAPAAELYTSAEDIAPFISLQFRDGDSTDVLKGSTLREMHAPESRGGPSDFAIGWEFGSLAGHGTIGHPGIVYGFTTQITLVPDSKLGVAVFTNGRTDPAAIANMALAALMPPVRAAASR